MLGDDYIQRPAPQGVVQVFRSVDGGDIQIDAALGDVCLEQATSTQPLPCPNFILHDSRNLDLDRCELHERVHAPSPRFRYCHVDADGLVEAF
jgi:hypothetical protein